jgi:hypothetical protein
MFDNYICEKCNNKYLYRKPYGEDFPEFLEIACESCGNTCKHKRQWHKEYFITEVQNGLLGNASNGYTNQITDHGSAYAPKKSKSKLGKEFMYVDTQGKVV